MSTKYYDIYIQCQASVLNTVEGYESYEKKDGTWTSTHKL